LSPADTDRRATWERTGQEVAELTDGLGMHIDPGIRDAVTALRLLGLRTEASCEGHDSWGVGAPWVSIGAHPTPELTELQNQWTNARQVATDLEARNAPRGDITAAHSRAHEFREKLKSVHLRPAATLLPLLEEFYIDRQRSVETGLTIAFISLSRSRLQSLGAEFQALLPVELRIPKLAAYQREMADFTTFLRQRYLAD
jgi:hypothetical protein